MKTKVHNLLYTWTFLRNKMTLFSFIEGIFFENRTDKRDIDFKTHNTAKKLYY